MWTEQRRRELDILEMVGLAGGIDESELVLEDIPDSIYRIAKRLNKPVTPPDLTHELPTLNKILSESKVNKTSLIVKTDSGDILYIIWGVIVCGLMSKVRVSHVIKI